MSNPFETFNKLVKKQDISDDNPSIFILNKIYSFHNDERMKKISFNMDKYINKIDDYYIKEMYSILTPEKISSKVNYISKGKESGNKYTDNIYMIFRKFYGEEYSRRDIENIISYMIDNEEDKLNIFLVSSGLEKKEITKNFPQFK